MEGKGTDEPLFERVGLLYRAVRPRRSETVPPTHVLRVTHPADESQCWMLDISVVDDDQARARQRQLRDWVDFDGKIFLYRVGQPGKPLCFVRGTRED